MSRTRPAFVVALALLSVAPALRGQQPLPLPPAPASVTLSPEEMDVFLRTAKITKKAIRPIHKALASRAACPPTQERVLSANKMPPPLFSGSLKVKATNRMPPQMPQPTAAPIRM